MLRVQWRRRFCLSRDGRLPWWSTFAILMLLGRILWVAVITSPSYSCPIWSPGATRLPSRSPTDRVWPVQTLSPCWWRTVSMHAFWHLICRWVFFVSYHQPLFNHRMVFTAGQDLWFCPVFVDGWSGLFFSPFFPHYFLILVECCRWSILMLTMFFHPLSHQAVLRLASVCSTLYLI